MPIDLWNGAVRMAGCGLVVAACAVPVALLTRFIARRSGEPFLPKPRRWPVPWTGLELLILFPFTAAAPSALVDPLLTASGFYHAVYGAEASEKTWSPMRPLWDAMFFTPVFVGVLLLLRHMLYQNWKTGSATLASVCSRTSAGVAGWLVIHPPVWLVHFVISAIFLAFSWTADEHPLEKSFRDGRPELDRVLLFVQAAIMTPILEEILFRGLLLPWIFGKKHRDAIAMGLATFVALAFGYQRGENDNALLLGPMLFGVFLLAGWFALRHRHPRKLRTLSAVYAQAALFAVVHSSVWPTPIPLFVLGIGLGWLAMRTRGILAPVIVHGLFNAVSVLFVLRGG